MDDEYKKLLIDAAGSLGSGIINSIPSALYNLYMYNDAKEYNKPLNQKKRLLEAGLSPAAASQALAGSSASAPTPVSLSNSGGTSDYIAMSQLALQKKLIESEINKNNAETGNIETQTNRLLQLTPIEVKKMSQDIRESVSREHLNGANKRLVELTADRMVKMTPLELEQLEQLIKKTKSEILLNHQSFKNMKAEYSLIKANTNSVFYDTQLKMNTLRLANLLKVDPNSPWYMQVVQSIAQGDTSPLDAILKGMWNVQTGMYDHVRSGIDSFLDTFF